MGYCQINLFSHGQTCISWHIHLIRNLQSSFMNLNLHYLYKIKLNLSDENPVKFNKILTLTYNYHSAWSLLVICSLLFNRSISWSYKLDLWKSPQAQQLSEYNLTEARLYIKSWEFISIIVTYIFYQTEIFPFENWSS